MAEPMMNKMSRAETVKYLNDRGQTFSSLSVLIALVLCGGYYLLMPEWRLSQLLLDIEEGLLPKTCTKPPLLKFNLNASSLERNEKMDFFLLKNQIFVCLLSMIVGVSPSLIQ